MEEEQIQKLISLIQDKKGDIKFEIVESAGNQYWLGYLDALRWTLSQIQADDGRRTNNE